MLGFLRDKKDGEGKPLPLGNRRSIDALIATHAVIYDAGAQQLFVSQGPGVSGGFIGFDLARSFSERTPIVTRRLPPDPLVDRETFRLVRESLLQIDVAQNAVDKGECWAGHKLLKERVKLYRGHSNYYLTLGNIYECLKQPVKARAAWERALELSPAYASKRDYLKRKLNL